MSRKLVYLVSFVLVLGLVGAAYGTEGLKGEYYHATIAANELQDLVLTRIDPMVDFDWGANSPEPGVVNPDNFTVRWTGTIEVPNSETYTFYTEGDDGIKLWVNNELIIDTWTWSKTWHVTQPPIEFGSGEIIRYFLLIFQCVTVVRPQATIIVELQSMTRYSNRKETDR